MPIRISGKRFNNELRPTQDLSYLIGCIGEKITAEVDFYYENILLANEDVTIGFKPTPTKAGDTLDTGSMILLTGSDFFGEQKIGDFIEVKQLGASFANDGVYQILEILDAQKARLSSVFVDDGTDPNYKGGYFGQGGADGYIANVTPLHGLRYSFNLLDSGVNYESLIDGETQIAQTPNADATSVAVVPMPLNGKLSYQYGGVTAQGGGAIVNAQQRFTIKHTWAIVPFFLYDQYDDLLARVKPNYYEAANCLNYISKIDIGKSLNDPNALASLQVDNSASNTGWFNENFNGKPNKYSIESLVITRLSDSVPVNDLEISGDFQIVATIINPDAVFFDTTSQCVFGFNYLPEAPELYQGNGYDLQRNFLFDSKKAVDAVLVNGDNFGTPMQVIKTVNFLAVTANKATVTVVINFGTDAQAILQQGDFKRYMFWVIVENPNLPAADSDKVNLLLHVGEIYRQLTKIDLIDQETRFLEHPYSDFNYSKPTLEAFPVDDIVAKTEFSIDFTGLENDGISIKAIRPRIKLKKTGQVDIVLESKTINTSNSLLVGSLPAIQNIDIQQDLVYKREIGIHKTLDTKRDFLSDTGDEKFWYLTYPFMNRWEYWIALSNIDNAPADLFDATLPKNGLNNLWDRLANVTGWDLYYDVEFEIEQNGVLFSQEFSTLLSSVYFLANTDWTNCSIKSFDIDTAAELTNGGNKYLLGYKDTKIEATFEKTTGAIPDVSQVAMAIWIEPFEGLGKADIRMISSVYDVIAASWFKSPTNKVTLAQAGGVFTGTCYLDFTKLPSNKKFTVYARIYEVEGIVFNSLIRITNDLKGRLLMNGRLRGIL